MAIFFKFFMGGLWVGGTLSLHTDCLRFNPNKLNKRHHELLSNKKINLDQVKSVIVRKGTITDIIDIQMLHGILSVRCFGAHEFAKKINDLIVK